MSKTFATPKAWYFDVYGILELVLDLLDQLFTRKAGIDIWIDGQTMISPAGAGGKPDENFLKKQPCSNTDLSGG